MVVRKFPDRGCCYFSGILQTQEEMSGKQQITSAFPKTSTSRLPGSHANNVTDSYTRVTGPMRRQPNLLVAKVPAQNRPRKKKSKIAVHPIITLPRRPAAHRNPIPETLRMPCLSPNTPCSDSASGSSWMGSGPCPPCSDSSSLMASAAA